MCYTHDGPFSIKKDITVGSEGGEQDFSFKIKKIVPVSTRSSSDKHVNMKHSLQKAKLKVHMEDATDPVSYPCKSPRL